MGPNFRCHPPRGTRNIGNACFCRLRAVAALELEVSGSWPWQRAQDGDSHKG